jgi:hypothetical protein
MAVIVTQIINILSVLLCSYSSNHQPFTNFKILLTIVDCTQYGVVSLELTLQAWTTSTSHNLHIFHTCVSHCMAWTIYVHVMGYFDRQPTSHTTEWLNKLDLTQSCPTISKPNQERILWDQRVHTVLDAGTLLFTASTTLLATTVILLLWLLLLLPTKLNKTMNWVLLYIWFSSPVYIVLYDPRQQVKIKWFWCRTLTAFCGHTFMSF